MAIIRIFFACVHGNVRAARGNADRPASIGGPLCRVSAKPKQTEVRRRHRQAAGSAANRGELLAKGRDFSLQFTDPLLGFDADPETAISTRKALIDRAATDKIKLIGFHYAYPGVGFAEKKDSAYAFVKA